MNDAFVPAPVRSAAFESSGSEAADIEACRKILDEGSKSFAAASRLLPKRMRAPASAFYAFCRVADDLVDFSDNPGAAVTELAARLDRIYAQQPDPDPVDRAFARVVARFEIPRVVVDALIDGFAWDADSRTYETLEDVEAYCARVASAVGVVMTLFMGPRDRKTLARACDLGVAMQLTNICRDVAEDAGRGRLYLPAKWLRERGIDPNHFTKHLDEYAGNTQVAEVIELLLHEADVCYRRADTGIAMLPRDVRPAIRAASTIYADIGRMVRAQHCDPTRGRAHTSNARKLWLLLRAWLRPTPHSDVRDAEAPVLDACGFLLDAFR